MEKNIGNHHLQISNLVKESNSYKPVTLRLIEEDSGKITSTPVVVTPDNGGCGSGDSPPPFSTVENSNSNSNSPDNDSNITQSSKVTGKRIRDSLAEAADSAINGAGRLKKVSIVKKIRNRKSADPTVIEEIKADNDVEKVCECTICGKVYDSPKALGGHKSSHTIRVKREGCPITASKKVEKSESELIHGCNVCSFTFSTTKALKMHQRSHSDQPPVPVESNSKGKVLDFDLNQMPPQEEEEEED